MLGFIFAGVGLLMALSLSKAQTLPNTQSTSTTQKIEAIVTGIIPSNNPGNLRPFRDSTGAVLPDSEQFQGFIGVTPNGFVHFDTPENGARAMMINAGNYALKDGIATLSALGDRWAPLGDNPGATVGEYGKGLADYLTKELGFPVSEDQEFNFIGNIVPLAKAITHNEWGTTYPDTVYQSQYAGVLSHLGVA